MTDKGPNPPGAFQTTHWSLVQRAGKTPDQAQREALGELARRYVPALRTYLMKRKGIDATAADDLVQGFLLSKILEQNLLSAANPQRGRFRGFLCAALDHYANSEFRRDRAKMRSPGATVSVEEAFAVPDHAMPVDEAFDMAWARQLLDEAIGRMRAECDRVYRKDVWGVFEARLLGPMLHHAEPIEYDRLVTQFGFASPAQASNVLITARRMFIRVLRNLVGEYEPDESAIDAEIAELQAILARSKPGGRPDGK